MRTPPPGYDDGSVIAHERLVQLVDRLEHELSKVKKVALENLQIAPHLRRDFENNFWQFRHAGEELGAEYSKSIDKLIRIYSQFLSSPSEEKLHEVMKELSHLKMLLEKH
jgi:hypothetical protein